MKIANKIAGWSLSDDRYVLNDSILVTKNQKVVMNCEVITMEPNKLLFKLEKDSSLEVVFDSNKQLNSKVEIDFILEEGSVVSIKELYKDFSKFSLTKTINASKNSKVKIETINIFSGELLTTTVCNLLEDNASINLDEINFGTSNSSSLNNLTVNHQASTTNSKINIKNAVKGNSTNIIDGHIFVAKKTINANTSLNISSLIVDEGAISRAIPGMEVESAEVQASHAVAISTIDEDHLFYLTTRGLSEEESKKEITKAFLVSLFNYEGLNDLIETQWIK